MTSDYCRGCLQATYSGCAIFLDPAKACARVGGCKARRTKAEQAEKLKKEQADYSGQRNGEPTGWKRR